MALGPKSGAKKQNIGLGDHLNVFWKLYPSRLDREDVPAVQSAAFPARRRRKTLKMAAPAVYDDNFGFWDIDGQEEQAFFEHVQRQSVEQICDRCERPARLMPSKTLCASCVAALECGAPTSMSKY